MTLLIDIGDVTDCHCNEHLEQMFKAMRESPDGDAERTIWTPHDNPFLTDHVEDVTRRLQAILARIQDALARALTGESIGDLAKADVPWMRWSAEGFTEARHRLEEKMPATYDLDDWMLLVDYLVQRYLPDGVIGTEAEYLTVRAQLMGKIEANMQARPAPNTLPPPALGALVDLVPTEFGRIPDKILSPTERNILRVAKARAADNISNVTAGARHRMKQIIVEHVQAQMLGQSAGQYTAMRQRLFDEFGQLNRDFRRIAVTEAGECCNTGFIASQMPGARVRRMEAYKGACPFCKSINGAVLTVVAPNANHRDDDTEVWVGKTNIGRSASPRMREGGVLVERPANQQWHIAAGVQHPHCRGSWTLLPDAPAGVKPEFASWLDDLLVKSRS